MLYIIKYYKNLFSLLINIMGNNSSTHTQNIKKNKYSDEEIKQNIRQLFENNKYNFVETSFSFNEPLDVSPENINTQNMGGGSKKKFKSSKNRHLTHNIE